MAATATVVESVHLSYRDGSSDKEYHIYLCDHGGLYSVHAEYGRRGSVSQRSEKGTFGSRSGARAEYAKLESEKRGKGYTEMFGSTRPPRSIPLGARPAPTAAPAAPVFDPALMAFNDKLEAYVTAMSADELSAGRAATARLATGLGVSTSKTIAGLPSYQPMVAMLGAIAFASQDYTDDAVELAKELITSRSGRKQGTKAVTLMPTALTDILTEVLTEHPRSDGLGGLVHYLFHKGRDTWFA